MGYYIWVRRSDATQQHVNLPAVVSNKTAAASYNQSSSAKVRRQNKQRWDKTCMMVYPLSFQL